MIWASTGKMFLFQLCFYFSIALDFILLSASSNWPRPQNWRTADLVSHITGELHSPLQLPIGGLESSSPAPADLVPERGEAERGEGQPGGGASGYDITRGFRSASIRIRAQQHVHTQTQTLGPRAGVCGAKPCRRRELQRHRHAQRPVWVWRSCDKAARHKNQRKYIMDNVYKKKTVQMLINIIMLYNNINYNMNN